MASTEVITFGAWLRERRKAHDLTQEQLGDLAGCAFDTIRAIEAGRRRPSRDMVAALARHLHVPPEDVPALTQFARSGPVGTEYSLPSVKPSVSPPKPQQRTNLPAWRTTFIGREQARADVCQQLMREDIRLLTLIGPPGIGKTRLSFQVGGDLLDEFRDGVFYVPLSPVSDHTLVGPAIAQTLGVKEVPGRPIEETLVGYLRDKQMLLVLDNFEQVVHAGPLVGRLLVECPHLTVLVSSRTALHVYGEHEFPVPPLSLPDLDGKQPPSVEELAQYEAVELFTRRSEAVRPDFALTADNAPLVAEICRRLDGLPLAIELAAARSKLLSPQALLARLNNMLDLLSAGMQDLPPRQQTLRGAIAWSYELLDEEERALYRRLSVFVGDITLEAVDAVCNAEGDLKTDVLDLVTMLVDKSLLRQEEDEGEPLFWMLWTIREYGLERLAQSGEEEAVKRSHAEYFLDLAEDAEPYLTGKDRGPWLEQLGEAHNNLRAALEWCLSSADRADMGLRLAGALHWFWYFRGYVTEGRDWLEKALAVAGTSRCTAVGAKALDAAGWLALLQDAYELMISRLEESVAVWREVADKRGLAYALSHLGLAKVYKDRDASSGGVSLLEEAVSLFREVGDKWGLAYALEWMADAAVLLSGPEQQINQYRKESLALYREVGDKWGIATELMELGHSALRQGDYEAARAMLEEALMHRATGDKWVTAHIIRSLGDVAWHQGDYAQAETLYRESLSLFQEVGDKLRASFSLRNLGRVAQSQGDLEEATVLYMRSLSMAYELGSVQNVALCLAALAGVVGAQGQPVRAARLFGAADALRDASHGLMPPSDLIEYNRNLTAVRGMIDEDTFAKAWHEGRVMTLDAAVAFAREEYTIDK